MLLELFIIAMLSIIVVQDMRFRKISWIPLPLLLMAFMMLSLKQNSFREVVFMYWFNFLFILVQHICFAVFFFIKKRKVFNLINTYHGIGDILFAVILCMAFSPMNFIHFYIISMCLTLLGYLLFLYLRSASSRGVPTAGGMALVLIVCFVFKMLNGTDFYSDHLFFDSF